MTPFCCSSRGGSHEKYRVRGVVASVEKLRGGPNGTASKSRQDVNKLQVVHILVPRICSQVICSTPHI